MLFNSIMVNFSEKTEYTRVFPEDPPSFLDMVGNINHLLVTDSSNKAYNGAPSYNAIWKHLVDAVRGKDIKNGAMFHSATLDIPYLKNGMKFELYKILYPDNENAKGGKRTRRRKNRKSRKSRRRAH